MPADPTPQLLRTYPVCHGPFAITHHSTPRHTYYSRRCRDIAANARHKAEDAEAEARLAATVAAVAALSRSAGAPPG